MIAKILSNSISGIRSNFEVIERITKVMVDPLCHIIQVLLGECHVSPQVELLSH